MTKRLPYVAVVKICFKVNIFSPQAHEDNNKKTLQGLSLQKSVVTHQRQGSPWSGVVGQLLAASRCAQGLVVSDKKHQAVIKDQREHAERKHRENTHKKHTENTNKKHRQKAQRENTDTKRRQKTQRENTDRNTD